MQKYDMQNTNQELSIDKSISPLGQLGFLIAFVGVGLMLGSALFAGMHYFIDAKTLETATAKNFLQIVAMLCTFLVPPLLLAKMFKSNITSFYHFNKKITIQSFLAIFVLTLCSILVSHFLLHSNEYVLSKTSLYPWSIQLEKSYFTTISQIINFNSIEGFILTTFTLAVLPAFAEELFFRGALQPILIKLIRHTWIGIILTALIFSLIHFSAIGFLPRLFLGVVLGALFHFSRNIWLSIFFHFINNFISVITLYFLAQKKVLTYEDMQMQLPTYQYIMGIIGFFVCYYWITKTIFIQKKSIYFIKIFFASNIILA